ncbi:DNA photolyase family protein [Halobacteria archaeon AArc-dxtr1]|nr:DNA photolyase family protein [Halobacteria archaeon AArc-dxtr1]
MELHWHRRDLRSTDNRGLAVAATDTVVPAFVFDPDVLEYASSPRVAFMLDSLSHLRSWYRERGSDLVIATGDPREAIPSLATEYGCDRVVWNRDYSDLARARDADVEAALTDVGVESAAYHDAIVHEPGSITTNEGEPYAVYSYFWKKWRDREKTPPYEAPSETELATVEGDPLPTAADLGFEEPAATVPDGGMAVAAELLEAFCEAPIYDYEAARDYPAEEGTSRLSPHLRWGTIGIRTVCEAVEQATDTAPDADGADSCEEFASQLAWRAFYTHVLAAHPRVVSRNYREYENPIEWADDPEGLDAWKRGETGYPFVDAGMRQLREEAYLHNRVRMVVASFLTKDLLIDWREGYAWFRERLADHDPANNSGGWQWAASTGTDAQPYFRIFNPTTQGERYDPDADYIREYVPELRDAPTEAIHEWSELPAEERAEIAPSYPDPIVDHATRREAALEMFQTARGEE